MSSTRTDLSKHTTLQHSTFFNLTTSLTAPALRRRQTSAPRLFANPPAEASFAASPVEHVQTTTHPAHAMLSAILFVNLKGEIVISRFYRDDVSRQVRRRG
jgi:hypothetical protein